MRSPNILRHAVAHVFQIRAFGSLPVKHQRDDVSRQAVWSSVVPVETEMVAGLIRLIAAASEGRVEELDVLPHAIFRKVKSSALRSVMAFPFLSLTITSTFTRLEVTLITSS